MSHIELISRGVHAVRGRLLLCHAKGKRNTYLPGGHIEFGEKATASLEREVLEELGCRSTAGRFLGGVEHTFMQKGQRVCEVNLVFQLTIPCLMPPAAPPSQEDYIEFLWWPLRDLSASGLEPFVLRRELPRWLRAGQKGDVWASTYGLCPGRSQQS